MFLSPIDVHYFRPHTASNPRSRFEASLSTKQASRTMLQRRTNGATRGRRTHSFGGCQTCRRRHLKCDLVKPTRLTCQAAGVLCETYRHELIWKTASTTNEFDSTAVEVQSGHASSTVTRQPLYKEEFRISMTKQLNTAFSSQSIDECLSEIDAQACNVHEGSGMQFGPLGIFHANEATSDVTDSQRTPDQAESFKPSDTAAASTIFNLSDPFASVDFDGGQDEVLNWSDLFELNCASTDLAFQNFAEMTATTKQTVTINPNIGLAI